MRYRARLCDKRYQMLSAVLCHTARARLEDSINSPTQGNAALQHSLQKHHVSAVGAVVVRLASILPNHVEGVVAVEDWVQPRPSLVGSPCPCSKFPVDLLNSQAPVQSVALITMSVCPSCSTVVWISHQVLDGSPETEVPETLH